MSENQNPLKSSEIRQICLNNGLIIKDPQWHLLEEWAYLLLNYNQEINLVSRKETDLLWEKQILHCLSLLVYQEIPQGLEVCDFGTGGGLPGIILAIIRPDLYLTLIDSRQKKVAVVQKVVDNLGLSNVRVICGRGELLGKQAEGTKDFQ
jgi:Predicted S-adenosylmethionine-dependent methyltransferase involved in bacterial cell division